MGVRNKNFYEGKERASKASVLSRLEAPVSVRNKYAIECDTCKRIMAPGEAWISASPGDTKWSAECHTCGLDKSIAEHDNEWGDWSTPASEGTMEKDY